MRVTTNRTKKTTNRIHAIWVAAPAMPLSPSSPAIKQKLLEERATYQRILESQGAVRRVLAELAALVV
jgi:hypothetical protein